MAQEPDRYIGWLNALKGLTFANVLVIALLVVIAVPVYVIYRALDDDRIMDRLMSTYEEMYGHEVGCLLRHAQLRGGPEAWIISAGVAFQGTDRWFVSAVLTHEPDADSIVSYCESAKLIVDTMLERGDKVYEGSMPGTETDRSGYYRVVPPEEDK